MNEKERSKHFEQIAKIEKRLKEIKARKLKNSKIFFSIAGFSFTLFLYFLVIN